MGSQNYNNWRGDSEKRFKFDSKFFTGIVAWGVAPFTLYYAIAVSERVRCWLLSVFRWSCARSSGGLISFWSPLEHARTP